MLEMNNERTLLQHARNAGFINVNGRQKSTIHTIKLLKVISKLFLGSTKD